MAWFTGMRTLWAILTVFWSLETLFAWNYRPNISKYALRSSIFMIKEESSGKVGGVYQYVGNEPPAELAELFGIKKSERKPKSLFTASRSRKEKNSVTTNNGNEIDLRTPLDDNKQSPAKKYNPKKTSNSNDVSIEELERQVMSKYGSKIRMDVQDDDDWDEEEDDERTGKRQPRFEGFDPKYRLAINEVSQVKSTKSTEETIEQTARQQFQPGNPNAKIYVKSDSKENKFDPDFEERQIVGQPTRQQFRSANPSANIYAKSQSKENKFDNDFEGRENTDSDLDSTNVYSNGPRSGPLNAVNGYRLRRPPPLNPEQQAKLEAIAATIALKEQLKLRKKQLQKQSELNHFIPFSFDNYDIDVKNDSVEDTVSDTNHDEDDDEVEDDNIEFSDTAKVKVESPQQIFTTSTFEDIGIHDPIILQNLAYLRIYNPTKIQSIAIPTMMEGKDVIMQAQTGSGKTLAFLLPMLNVIDPNVRKIQAIILAPSRELVTQIGQVGKDLFNGTPINVVSIIGGANVQNQIKQLRTERPQIIVATPGRLAELVFRLERIKLGMVKAVVIDEVDNLLQEPYLGEIETILESTRLFGRDNKSNNFNIIDDKDEFDCINGMTDINFNRTLNSRMICFASATSNSPEVTAFAEKYCPDGYTRVAVKSATQLPHTITHGLISTPRMRALEMLKKFLKSTPAIQRALIFVNEPHRVEVICDMLLESGIVAAPLHGDCSKEDRKEVMARIRDGRLSLVVTTELAARGLDIPDITHVINFELPTDSQHYIHRAGRCGRAGRKGLVINFATTETKFVIRRFGKRLGVKIYDCELREGKVFLKQ